MDYAKEYAKHLKKNSKPWKKRKFTENYTMCQKSIFCPIIQIDEILENSQFWIFLPRMITPKYFKNDQKMFFQMFYFFCNFRWKSRFLAWKLKIQMKERFFDLKLKNYHRFFAQKFKLAFVKIRFLDKKMTLHSVKTVGK